MMSMTMTRHLNLSEMGRTVGMWLFCEQISAASLILLIIEMGGWLWDDATQQGQTPGMVKDGADEW